MEVVYQRSIISLALQARPYDLNVSYDPQLHMADGDVERSNCMHAGLYSRPLLVIMAFDYLLASIFFSKWPPHSLPFPRGNPQTFYTRQPSGRHAASPGTSVESMAYVPLCLSHPSLDPQKSSPPIPEFVRHGHHVHNALLLKQERIEEIRAFERTFATTVPRADTRPIHPSLVLG